MRHAFDSWTVGLRWSALALALLGASAGCSSRTSSAPLPFGFVDAPTSGEAVQGEVRALGWALCEGGPCEIAFYVDRRFVKQASAGPSRPDVAKAYPDVPGAETSAWEATLSTQGLGPGPHELVVQARSKAGATRDLAGTLQIVVKR